MGPRERISSNSTAGSWQLGCRVHLSRRHFLTGIGIGGIFLRASANLRAESPAVAHEPRTGLLVQPQNVPQLNTRSKIVLELDGTLRINESSADKEGKPIGAEVKAKSTLDYFEKIAFADSLPLASARRHVEAVVENWISGSASGHKLRPECMETRMMMHSGWWQPYCENEPLDVREVELLHSPLNTAAVELLLPKNPAKLDTNWSISAEDAQLLFNLEAVQKSTLKAQTVKVEKGIASMKIEGELDATANSVPTHLRINGNFHAKLASQCALVTWVGLAIKEEREISQAEPGFSITARVRLIREETRDPFSISDQDLRNLASQPDPGRWLVRLQSTAGRYTMLADRRWHVYLDSGEEAILRMIENNTVIAQCNINRLAELGAGQQVTLEGLQADIQKSLGEGFGQFLESSEKVTSSGLRLVRIVVAGELEEVPIQWIYDHLSDDSGRRIAMVFTMGGNVTDRFAAADEQMTSSFSLLPTASDDSPLPKAAPKLSAELPAELPAKAATR